MNDRRKRILDGIALLVTGFIVSALVGIFWFYSGSNGTYTVLILSLIGTAAENRRLRRELKNQSGKQRQN